MSATLTINRQCSRCSREDREEVTVEDAARAGLASPTALRVEIDGVAVIEFDNLCGVCRNIVDRYLENVGRQLKGKSSRFRKDDVSAGVEESGDFEIEVEDNDDDDES